MKMGDKVIVYGYIDGYSYETTGQTNYIIALETGERVEIPLGVAINADEIVFKDNIKLKDVIKRIKGFDNGTKFKWTYDILKELGSDFASKIFHERYQQGRFDEAVETHHEPEKVTIPQFVADWIEECKNDDFHLFGAMEAISLNRKKLDYWFREDDNMELFARAWLDGYEVEKEPKYTVKIKATKHYFAKDGNGRIYFSLKYESAFTKIELEKVNLGWVFDCPGIELEEVTE